METVTVRDLRNHGGDILNRVRAGEHLVVTRAGEPVAELLPLHRAPLPVGVVLQRWARLPIVDPVAFRTDIDELLDPGA